MWTRDGVNVYTMPWVHLKPICRVRAGLCPSASPLLKKINAHDTIANSPPHVYQPCPIYDTVETNLSVEMTKIVNTGTSELQLFSIFWHRDAPQPIPSASFARSHSWLYGRRSGCTPPQLLARHLCSYSDTHTAHCESTSIYRYRVRFGTIKKRSALPRTYSSYPT